MLLPLLFVACVGSSAHGSMRLKDDIRVVPEPYTDSGVGRITKSKRALMFANAFFFFDQSSSPFRRCTEGKVSPRIAKGSTVVGRGVVDTKCEGRRRLHTLGLAGPRGLEREEEIYCYSRGFIFCRM